MLFMSAALPIAQLEHTRNFSEMEAEQLALW